MTTLLNVKRAKVSALVLAATVGMSAGAAEIPGVVSYSDAGAPAGIPAMVRGLATHANSIRSPKWLGSRVTVRFVGPASRGSDDVAYASVAGAKPDAGEPTCSITIPNIGLMGVFLRFCCDSAASTGKARRRQSIRKPASRTCLLRTRLAL